MGNISVDFCEERVFRCHFDILDEYVRCMLVKRKEQGILLDYQIGDDLLELSWLKIFNENLERVSSLGIHCYVKELRHCQIILVALWRDDLHLGLGRTWLSYHQLLKQIHFVPVVESREQLLTKIIAVLIHKKMGKLLGDFYPVNEKVD